MKETNQFNQNLLKLKLQ